MTDPSPNADRYARQIAYRNLGHDAQRMLARARVVLIGCGAMGGMQAQLLVRAGIGHLRIVDHDAPLLTNLHRQVLYDEQDVADATPKAVAARAKLLRANSSVEIEAEVARADRTNIERLIDRADLILDGTDNMPTRYVINDAAVKHRIPWIYGGVVADYGTVIPILPGQTPCLRCLFPDPPDPPDPDDLETCETAGVLASAVAVVAALQATEAIKILTAQLDAVTQNLQTINVWRPHLQETPAPPRNPDCPTCAQNRFDYL